eukprot:2542505-Amphidinium_carterae.1
MKPKARKKIKSKRELLLPFCSLLETRDSYEVADHIRTMIQEVETFVSPLLPSCLPSSRVLQVHVDLPCSTGKSAEERIVNLEALVKPLLPPGHNQCVVRVHSDRVIEFNSSEVAWLLGAREVFQTFTSGYSFK